MSEIMPESAGTAGLLQNANDSFDLPKAFRIGQAIVMNDLSYLLQGTVTGGFYHLFHMETV